MNPFLAAMLAAHLQVGVGYSLGTPIGDGVWFQQGAVTSSLNARTPVVTAGFSGPLWSHGASDVRWNLDYFYIGQQSASCQCVPDVNYDSKTHQVVNWHANDPLSPFNGVGHIQGVAATLDAGYTKWGYRFGAQAGPTLLWQTWHESLYNTNGQWQTLDHRTAMQVSWTAGVSVSDGPWSVAYRYYALPQQWNPYPALLKGVHTVTLNYTF